MSAIKVSQKSGYILGEFVAMASPCELLCETDDLILAQQLTQLAATEAWRIEQRYSRYREDNLIYQINNSQGGVVAIDDELYQLLSFADQCYQLSDGLFDITSGVLRRTWRFDGSDNIPSQSDIDAVLPLVGWQQVTLQPDKIQLVDGMEIDLGGIGKEYAVDKVCQQLRQQASDISVLVNFGGDMAVTRPRRMAAYWTVGIEHPDRLNQTKGVVTISQGALATSGDARRFLRRDGVRYSHILNPKTGWPIADAPRSMTVAYSHCVQAGLLATLALMQGNDAETFLDAQSATYWCVR